MKCLIVSGGVPPSISDLKKHSRDAALIIAADSAADVFIRLHSSGKNISAWPHVVIGDFDSAAPGNVSVLADMGAKVIALNVDKNETDTQAAVDYALESGADEIVILGATGKRMDHTLGNIAMLLRAAQAGAVCRLIDRYNDIAVATDEYEIHGRKGQTVSILPLTADICVNATHLKYPLKELKLRMNASRGISNIIEKSPAHLSISGGWALVVKIRQKA